MRLYLAGIYTANFHRHTNLYARLTEDEKRQRDSVTWLLESYHYFNKPSKYEPLRKDGRRIFLDSGAYSAFTQGAHIDLRGYCAFIKRNLDWIDNDGGTILASVLDGIGDAKLTYENQLAMESLGVRPLPCFHYGEDERYLEFYLSRYDYITLGGMVPVPPPQLILWLDRIWDRYLTDGSGRPKTRVHGFGLSQISLMKRYPWYSVDSSSWVQIARVGGMMLLDGSVISVSQVSPNRKVAGRHIDTISEIERKEIERQFLMYNVDLKRMRETYLARWAYNIWAYDMLGRMGFKDDPRFIKSQNLLFG